MRHSDIVGGECMFIGINVAKIELVVSILPSGERFAVANSNAAYGRSSNGSARSHQH